MFGTNSPAQFKNMRGRYLGIYVYEVTRTIPQKTCGRQQILYLIRMFCIQTKTRQRQGDPAGLTMLRIQISDHQNYFWRYPASSLRNKVGYRCPHEKIAGSYSVAVPHFPCVSCLHE